MFKNVAAKFMVFAFDSTTNLPKTGDGANLTAYVSKDYGTVTVLADTSATEMDATNGKGYYLFDAAQGETNADILMVSAKSSTANIVVIGAPAVVYTRPTTGWLAPTTAARTLDVSAGGEAGVDWANVGSPTTALALTATTIAVTQKVDVDTIKTNPVVNGGTITFPTTATLASTTNLTAGTVAAVSGAVGSVTARVTANTDQFAGQTVTAAAGVTLPTSVASPTNITAGTITTTTNLTNLPSIPANWITAAGITDGALTAAKFAAGAFDAVWSVAARTLTSFGTLAADVWAVATRVLTAGTNIVLAKGTGVTGFNDPTAAATSDAVWEEALSDHSGTSGSTAEALAAAGGAGDPWITPLPGSYTGSQAGKILADVLVDTGTTLDGRLPAALTSGKMEANVGAVTAGAIAAASFASGALDAVWSTATRTLTSFGTVAADVWAVATRVLTAGTNIVLAKGTGLTGLNDLSTAQINTEADTALADVGVTATVTGRIDVAVSTRLATSGYTAPLTAAGIRSAVGLASANLDTQLDALPTNAELATALAAADDAVLAAIAALNNLSAAQARTQMDAALDSTVPDSIPTDGTRPSMRQALYIINQYLMERSISGTTATIKKVDGSTTLLTQTLNDAVTPTSVTRAT